MTVVSRHMCYYHARIFRSNPWSTVQRLQGVQEAWTSQSQSTTNPLMTFARTSATNSTPESSRSDDVNLVYSGSLHRQVKMIKWFSLSTSAIGLSIQPVLWKAMNASTSVSSSFMFGFAATTAAAVVVTPLLLNLVTKRYVTRLYFDADDKTFVLHSLNFFNRQKTTEFTAEDVKVPTITGPFTSFTVFGKPFFVDPLAFNDLAVYEHLMGYDKDPLEKFPVFQETSSQEVARESVEKQDKEVRRQ